METRADPFTIIREHQKKPPVDVLAIAKNLGLSVYTTKKWDRSISGVLTKDKDGYYILVNGNHHANRRRFTVAHEIAHYILHKDDIGDGIEDSALYRSHLSSRKETQANRLAADILMPWDLLSSEIDKEETKSVEELANIFKVSGSAMSIRLEVPLEE